MSRLMVMAGGTGGHVMPALAVARKLRERGVEIRWMGNADGLEAKLVPDAGFELEFISIKGLRQSGLKRKLMMPFILMRACLQSLKIILRWRPDVLLGMGGFVSGPGGLVAGLMGKPLVLHEQNAVAGLTNRWLAPLAREVLSGFPLAKGIKDVKWVGNPVREPIRRIAAPETRFQDRKGALRILIVGGSQGARVFNDFLPQLLADEQLPGVEVWHQCGRSNGEKVTRAYQDSGVHCRVDEFIDDMAEAYSWSDLVICRAGAMTVSEVSVAGVVALFIPYPYAVNDHQARNAEYLVSGGAALACDQSQFVKGAWISQLATLGVDRGALVEMAKKARSLARLDATDQVADICEALIHA